MKDEPIFYHHDECDCIKCLARVEKGGLEYDPSNDNEEFEEHERQVFRDKGITKLNIQELGLLKELANRTWQEIAPGAVEILGSPAPRDSVFELVIDRLSDFADSIEEKRLVKRFLSLGKGTQALKEELLPFESYE